MASTPKCEPVFLYTGGSYTNYRVEILQMDGGAQKFLITPIGETDFFCIWVSESALSASGDFNSAALDVYKKTLASLS